MWSSAFILVLLVLALALIAWSLFGPRVGVASLCRRCGYEVDGLGGVRRCPECGFGLWGSGVVRGHKPRRMLARSVGVAVLCLCVIDLSYRGSVSMRGYTVVQTLPTSILINRLKLSQAEEPIAELLVRVHEGTVSVADLDLLALRFVADVDLDAPELLVAVADSPAVSPAVAGQLAEAMLSRQADRSLRWEVAWGNALESLIAGGRLTSVQIERYIKNCADPLAFVQYQTPAQGEIVPVLTNPRLRAGTRASHAAKVVISVESGCETVPMSFDRWGFTSFEHSPSWRTAGLLRLTSPEPRAFVDVQVDLSSIVRGTSVIATADVCAKHWRTPVAIPATQRVETPDVSARLQARLAQVITIPSELDALNSSHWATTASLALGLSDWALPTEYYRPWRAAPQKTKALPAQLQSDRLRKDVSFAENNAPPFQITGGLRQGANTWWCFRAVVAIPMDGVLNFDELCSTSRPVTQNLSEHEVHKNAPTWWSPTQPSTIVLQVSAIAGVCERDTKASWSPESRRVLDPPIEILFSVPPSR